MDELINKIASIVEYTMKMMPQMMDGLGVTLQVFILTLIFSIPLGVIVALCRLSRVKVVSKIME